MTYNYAPVTQAAAKVLLLISLISLAQLAASNLSDGPVADAVNELVEKEFQQIDDEIDSHSLSTPDAILVERISPKELAAEKKAAEKKEDTKDADMTKEDNDINKAWDDAEKLLNAEREKKKSIAKKDIKKDANRLKKDKKKFEKDEADELKALKSKVKNAKDAAAKKKDTDELNRNKKDSKELTRKAHQIVVDAKTKIKCRLLALVQKRSGRKLLGGATCRL